MCRFVPFWLRVLQSEGINPAAVLVLRNPLAVARSLRARDRIEVDLSLLIWLRHVLDAEFHTRPVRRTFVRYQEVVEHWRSVAGRISRDLEIPWPSGTLADEAEIDRFVRSDLRHYQDELDSSDVSPVVGEWLRRTSAALQQLQDDDVSHVAAFADLDAVRLEFERATSALGDVGDRIRGQLQSQIEDLQSRVEDITREQHALAHHAQALEEQRDVLYDALSAARYDSQSLRESASWRITAPLRAAYRFFR
jgi:hypothetical protein